MLLSEILLRLSQPVPRQFIKQKKTWEKGKSSGQVDYIPWFNCTDLLDDRCGLGGWSWEIKSVQQIENNLVIVGSLTIHGEDRSITREATGIEEVQTSSFGDPSSNAEAMCLRRACSKFGLGRDLWRKEERQQEPQLPRVSQPIPAKGTLTREEWLARKREREAN
jgi:hypothetical protein